ncbi:hypothetical protein H5410_002413 [Solanum commersonii]|uniref:Ulp1 protease family, C-terminal catalytic domain containing protein n=1 Tax=Solanum commersonii TaxID=4109 RepID=A0A9J6B203_SOLCO|nr:hypothetical protein H5410_002413 [Solanum commersonii]
MKLRMMGSKLSIRTFPMHFQPNATDDSIIRSVMGKKFDSFRKTLRENDLEDIFRNTCFGFIFYNNEKKDEVLINYCGMPIFFGKKEFAIVTRLKWQSPSKPIPVFATKNNRGDERKEKHKQLRNSQLRSRTCDELTVKYLLGPLSPKTSNLFGFPWAFMAWAFQVIPHLSYQVIAKEEISSPRILRWLTTKNVKNPPDLFNPSDDALNEPHVAIDESFVAADASYVAIYHPSVATCDPNIAAYVATMMYLLQHLYVTTDDASVATYDPNIATDAPCVATYHPPVVHLWLVPTENEWKMSFMITLGLVETVFDPVVDRVKRELVGATTINVVDNIPFMITLGLVETLFDPVVDRVERELVRATTINVVDKP